MSNARFGLLVGLAAAVVAAASFALGVAVLDDDRPDPPPVSTADTSADAAAASSSTTSATGAALPTPAWVAVVSSDTDEGNARSAAARVEDAGFPAGVLRSDDHTSLSPGFWVAYAGPYPSRAEADAGVAALAEAGIGGAYARCVGTEAECAPVAPTDGGDGGDADDGPGAEDDGGADNGNDGGADSGRGNGGPSNAGGNGNGNGDDEDGDDDDD